MSVINSDSMRAGAAGAGGAAYIISQSLRFNDDDSAYLSRTPSGAGSSTTICTISFWMKTCNVSAAERVIFMAGSSSSNYTTIELQSVEELWTSNRLSASTKHNLYTSGKNRDPGAWKHVVMSYDSGQSEGDRVVIYENGVRTTAYATEVYPNAAQTMIWNTAVIHTIGRSSYASQYYGEFYLADVIVCDGQRYAASNFGEFDDNGNWVPTDPSSLTFGTNGFHLDFAVASGTGNGAGTDVSGNDNHFTDSGLAANDQVTDSPTDDADNDVGNYAVFNVLHKTSNSVIRNGNLDFDTNSNAWYTILATLGITNASGKYYWEATLAATATGQMHGAAYLNEPLYDPADSSPTTMAGSCTVDAIAAYFEGSSLGNVSPTPTTTSVWSFAYDSDTRKMWMGVDDTWFNVASAGTGDPAAGTNPFGTFSGTQKCSPLVFLGGVGTPH